MEYLSRIKSEWLTFAESKARRIEFLFSATLITTIMFCLLFYLRYNETRAGVVLQDPLIAMIPPADLSNLTFVLIYSGIVSTVIMLLTHPMRLTIGFQIYAVYAALRLLGDAEIKREPDSLRDLWLQLATQAKTSGEKQKIIFGLVNFTDDWAVKLLEGYVKDDDDRVVDAVTMHF